MQHLSTSQSRVVSATTEEEHSVGLHRELNSSTKLVKNTLFFYKTETRHETDPAQPLM